MSESPNWSNPLRDSRDLRLPRIAGPCSLVIFGVTGDLAQKKLLPAVYDLANRGLLPPSFGLTGFARRDWTQERFIEFVKKQFFFCLCGRFPYSLQRWIPTQR